MRTQYGQTECSTCQTSFEGLPVEHDGDRIFAILETTACPVCFVQLCPCCNATHCQDCGAFVCSSHIVIIPDGTPKPLELCPACAAEALQQELELEPVPDLIPSCPQCHGQDVDIRGYHFGVSEQTGYVDAGERFECRACGATDDVEELEQLPERPARLEPGTETQQPRRDERVA